MFKLKPGGDLAKIFGFFPVCVEFFSFAFSETSYCSDYVHDRPALNLNQVF